jgi:antitoxin CptB
VRYSGRFAPIKPDCIALVGANLGRKMMDENTPIGAIAKNVVDDSVRRARLLWRSKRGLLENDIVMTRFFQTHTELTNSQVYGLDLLLDLPDDELFALIMSRKELSEVDPSEHLMDEQDMRQADAVLQMLRVV